MEAPQIDTYILGGLLAVAGYFLKKVLADVDNLKKAEVKHQLTDQKIESNLAMIERNEKVMFKKFTNLHTKNDAQEVLNTEFKVLFASIVAKQDQTLMLLKEIKNKK